MVEPVEVLAVLISTSVAPAQGPLLRICSDLYGELNASAAAIS